MIDFRFSNDSGNVTVLREETVRVYVSGVDHCHKHMDKMEKKLLIDRIFKGVFAIAALVFSVSYAFGQYVHYRESNVRDLNAWMDCVRTEQFTDRAYEFCREKTEENYIFKKHYDWEPVSRAAIPADDKE